MTTCPINWSEYLRYEPESGILFWKNARKGISKGSVAGSLHKRSGYIVVMLDGASYQVHRIIWDLENPTDKVQCDEQIDHIDHNRANNSLVNLRKVKAIDNSRNRSKYSFNKSGVTGVLFDNRRGKWRAEICIFGKTKHLGRFDTLAAAVSARKDAEIFYGFHENHGK